MRRRARTTWVKRLVSKPEAFAGVPAWIAPARYWLGEEVVEMSSREKALLAARAASDKKATDIVVQFVAEILKVSDYFVLATGNTNRQIDAIVEGIEESIKAEFGLSPESVEGLDEMKWVVLDYGDVVVHVFDPDTREYYRLETLWGDADVVNLQEAGIDDAPYSERIAKYIQAREESNDQA